MPHNDQIAGKESPRETLDVRMVDLLRPGSPPQPGLKGLLFFGGAQFAGVKSTKYSLPSTKAAAADGFTIARSIRPEGV